MQMRQRPNGEDATSFGWALIVLGVIAGFASVATETDAAWFAAIAIANLAIGLGVLLLSLGYLVKAIWFLPGREIPVEEPPLAQPIGQVCDWCERTLPVGAIACTSITSEQLARVVDKVADPICIDQLIGRGLRNVDSDGQQPEARDGGLR